MMVRRVSRVTVALATALMLVGCASKQKDDGSLAGEDAPGYGEEALGADGARPGGSLALAQQGGRAPGDTGPLRDIHFDYDSFELTDAARQTLQENAQWLKDNPQMRVEIEGHCDDRGTVEYNLALGAKRAAAAKSYLVALGIGRDRLTTISYGEELPLCHEETEACWSENRRAHFVPVGG